MREFLIKVAAFTVTGLGWAFLLWAAGSILVSFVNLEWQSVFEHRLGRAFFGVIWVYSMGKATLTWIFRKAEAYV